jgi:hypothetical protein
MTGHLDQPAVRKDMIERYPEDSPEDGGMNNGGVDRLPVGQLPDRYNLVRSAVYTRMDALGIKPERIGNKSYVNAQQIELLDALHQFINSGGTTAEFLEMRGGQPSNGDVLEQFPGQSSGQSSGLSTVPPDFIQLVSSIAAEVASRFQAAGAEPDPLAYLEALERAAQNGWLLKTSEISGLLDLPVSEIQQCGDRFSEAGFVFTKAGYRSGGEVAWRVSKPVK